MLKAVWPNVTDWHKELCDGIGARGAAGASITVRPRGMFHAESPQSGGGQFSYKGFTSTHDLHGVCVPFVPRAASETAPAERA